LVGSVADSDSDFLPSRISDKSRTKNKQKFELIDKEFKHFNAKIITKLAEIWVWDPRSEAWDPEKKLIPDPGSRGQTSTVS
jgi:hypothetical protein